MLKERHFIFTDAYSIYSTRHKRRSQTQDLPTTSHSSYHDKMAASVRTHCSCWSIPRPLTCSASSHQSSACGLTSPTWSTKTNLASNDWTRPPAAQSRPQLGVEACTGPFQAAKTRGDGYVLPRTRHPMMMMKDMPLTYSGLFRHCVLLSIMYIFIMFWTHAIPWLMAKLLMQATWSCYISGIQRTLVKDIPCCNKWHRCKRFIWRYPAKRLYRSRPPVVTGRTGRQLVCGCHIPIFDLCHQQLCDPLGST